MTTGKADGSDSNVTLGFGNFSGDIITAPESSTDTDWDGVHDACDLDSDNDGISDLYESGSAAGIAADTNNDGTISLAEAAAANGGVADADGDGLLDIFDADVTDTSAAASVGTIAVDSDSDGVQDYLDLDSDNDLIADTIEARPTAGYVANDGDVSDNDADGDGVIDIFDSNDATTGDFGGTHANFNAPVDTDNDGTPDFLDSDSDDDGLSDTVESGLSASASGADTDGDGIDDGIAPNTYHDPDGVVGSTSADLANETGDLTEVAFRETLPLPDKDGDGIADVDDLDDDNDGILDSVESPVVRLDEERLRPFADLLGGTGTAPTGDFNDIGPADISSLWGLPAGSVIAEFQDTSFAGTTGNSIVAQDETNPSNGVGRLILTGTVPVEVRLVHGASLPAGDYDGIQINDGAPVAFTGTLGGDIVNTVIGNRNQVELPVGGTHPGTADFEWTTQSSDFSWFTNTGTSAIQLNLTPLLVGTDTDWDGIHNDCDLDSDNDGISDLYESGASAAAIAADTDGDGTVSLAESLAAVQAIDPTYTGDGDADDDGLMDIFDADFNDPAEAASAGTVPVDSDGDGVADYLDLDSDNDLIADTIESRPTAGYVANDGDVSNNDADGDGVVDIFDANDTTTGDFGGTHANFNAPNDHDGDGTPDHLDSDSDDDGLPDTAESGLAASASGVDADGDGIDDGIAPNTYHDPDGIVGTTSADLLNVDGDASDVDFRSLDVLTLSDKDWDGIPDDVDLDDDNDGILDTDEGFLTLPDGTPISDLLTTGLSTDEVVWNNALAQLLPAGLATLEDFENFSTNTPLNGQQFNGFTVNVSNSQNAAAEYDVDARQYGTSPLSGNRQATIQDNISAPAGNFADSLVTLEITCLLYTSPSPRDRG